MEPNANSRRIVYKYQNETAFAMKLSSYMKLFEEETLEEKKIK